MKFGFHIACLLTGLGIGLAQAGEVELVMPPFEISPQGDVSVFATPIDVQNGMVAVAFVTGPDADTTPGYMNTVVRAGRVVNGIWHWTTTRIDTRTLLDPYHTQPSLAFDRNGYLHVAYNMHNLPWQYVVSHQPYDVRQFDFNGQSVTLSQLDALRLSNKTHYPDVGKAQIPGNQITYPAFFKNRAGDLYLTYRYALRPARAWEERARAAAVARYDADNRTWLPVGGTFALSHGDADFSGGSVRDTTVFGYDPEYVPYLVTLAFDAADAMHAVWTWWSRSSNQSGNVNVYPSYRKLDDAAKPATIANVTSGRIPGWPDGTIFNTAKSLAIATNGDVLAILEPQGENRKLIRLDHSTGKWGLAEDTPNSASKILVDRDGNEWLFAAGLNLFRRAPGGNWSKPLGIGRNLCDPRPVYSNIENSFYILAKTCPAKDKAVVYRYRLD